MMIQYIIRTLRSYYSADKKDASLRNENRLVAILGAYIMLTGGVCSFLSLYFLSHIAFSELWFASVSMFALGIAVLALPMILKKDALVQYAIAAVFSFYLLFISKEYFSYIGPAIWTVSIVITAISMLYTNGRAVWIVSASAITSVAYFAVGGSVFDNWSTFYQAQIVALFILAAVLFMIRKIAMNQVRLIRKQYLDLAKAEGKLKMTLESVGDGVITIDPKGLVDLINPVAQKLTGFCAAEAAGKPFETVFHIINEYTREKVESPVETVFKTGDTIQLANHTLLISKDGTEIAVEDTAAPIRDESGGIIGCVLVFRDFSDRKEKQRKIEYLSFHDQLTGLFNRRYFEEALKRLDQAKNLPLSVVYADVNRLKIINDAFGHDQGDQLIQLIAERLNAVCRPGDVIARIGGDEFVILLPNTDAEAAHRLALRLKENTDQMDIKSIKASVAFGWDTKIEESQPISAVIKNAENWMYQKKILIGGYRRNGVVTELLGTMLFRFPMEAAHSYNVSRLCEGIGTAYHKSADEIETLGILGKLHDIGKIAVDEAFLSSARELSAAETEQMKQHSEIGSRLLRADSEYGFLAADVLSHHERWDGKGYPKGLRGENISWNARALAIANSYDAMTRRPSYKPSLTPEEAIEEIKRNAGTQFDPEIAKVFIEQVAGKPFPGNSLSSEDPI